MHVENTASYLGRTQAWPMIALFWRHTSEAYRVDSDSWGTSSCLEATTAPPHAPPLTRDLIDGVS